MSAPRAPRVGIVLALLVSSVAFGQEAPATAPPAADPSGAWTTTAPPSAPVASLDQVRAFQQTRDRFGSRMRELESDVREYLDLRERDERKKLSDAYDLAIAELDAAEAAQRSQTTDRLEQFLEQYPSVPYASHVRFRLADLYWEQSKEDWLASSATYYELEQKLEAEGREAELPEPPALDLGRTVGLYRRILADNVGLPKDKQYARLDGVYYSLAYSLLEENAATRDEDEAKALFQALIKNHPDSKLVDVAHLNIGNFWFEQPGGLTAAVAEYRVVFDKGEDNELYADAMYKLAWSYYREAFEPPEFAPALELFTKLLDYSDRTWKATGKRSDYAPDAIKYTAFSFADIAVRYQESGKPMSAVDVTRDYFKRVGAREYEAEVYQELATILKKYGRFAEAIEVYETLQTDARWRLEPENPEYQMEIVKLYASLAATRTSDDPISSEAYLERSAKARIALTERYNDQSDWWLGNKYNPEALAGARRYIEDSLVDVATQFLIQAQKTGEVADYAAAATKYREYVDRFPIADNFYEMQWFLALSLFNAKDFDNAAQEYSALVKSGKNHKYGDGSVFQRMRCRQEVAVEKHGPISQLPQDAVLEKSVETGFKRPPPDQPDAEPVPIKIDRYQLSEDHKALIASLDEVLAYPFREVEDPAKETDFRTTVEQNRSKLMYFPAQILHEHKRFDEARPRLLALIEKFPQTDEALRAARMMVDGYQQEGNLAEVRKYTTQFYTRVPSLGPPGSSDAKATREVFGNVREETDYVLAQAIADPIERAEAFLQFIADYPKSKNAKGALITAANAYEAGGKAEKSNELFERFVALYPTEEVSTKLFFRIATNYESVFELGKAIDYYERLVKYAQKTDPLRSVAYYNAAFLRIGLGQHQRAAEAFQAYAKEFPGAEDVETVYWQAGEQWEAVAAPKAVEFYNAYLKKYGLVNPEHALAAEAKLAELDTRNTGKWLDKILVDFDEIVVSGQQDKIGPVARSVAAKSAFRAIQAEYDKITSEAVYRNDVKDKELFERKRDVEIPQFRERTLATAQTYGDFEYLTAAFFLRASATLYYAELGYSVRPPKGLDEENEMLFQELLAEKWYPTFDPIQEQAKQEFLGLIEAAKKQKGHSVWVGKAYEKLNDLDPFAYPAEKRELRGTVKATIPPEVRPVLPPAPEPPKEGP